MLANSLATARLKFWKTKTENIALAMVELGNITYFKSGQ